MVRASLTLTIPERTWIGNVSRQFPEAKFQVRSAQSCNGIGVGFVELVASDPTEVAEEIERYDAVHTVEVFQQRDGRALVQIEAEEPILLTLLDKTGVPVEMPFEIADGQVRWELTTTRTRLSTLATELEQSDLGYMVEHIWDSAQFGQILTDRQQDVIGTALERGYYDSPRECTQEDLATELDMAKSTCSEILHRAEEQIIKQFEDGNQPVFTQPKQYA
ncbi:helix-turn-helix domain-containing protein [Halorussus salinisoli]|uniref:helix-turn-helix domain-containing protein n=1 Tax=Halorussus salinisoli TaxID=2558242 RepID=UPI0010C1D1DE|nr:helix-turn-helix domain-containing protein [Halorussus salinisoli]